MMGQLKVLLRVKTLKEEQALRELQAKRRQVLEGQDAVARAERSVRDSAATLEAREDAVYDGVIGRVIGLDGLDGARAAVVAIEQDHTRLTDAKERATHVLARLDRELDASAALHRAAAKVRDKYGLLLEDARERHDAAASAAEEGEVEELFGTRRRGIA